MERVGEESAVFTDLEESLCQDPDIDFVVVFGSRVSGEDTASSDLDVAVKFSGDLSSHERFRKRCFLAGELQQTERSFVDVSDIERLPLGVSHDAVNGELLCGDEETFREFRADVESEFEERRDEIRRQQRDVIERIAEDGLHG